MNRIRVLLERAPLLTLTREDTRDTVNQEAGLQQTANLPASWPLTFQPLDLWDISFWGLQAIQSMVFLS